MNSLSLLARRSAMVLAARGVPMMAQSAPVMGSQASRFARMWMSSHPKTAFAVDSPDGDSDALRDVELHEVEDIVDFAASHEDVDAVNKLHHDQDEAKKIFAVDSPSGDSDALLSEEIHEVDDIIDYAASHEDKNFVDNLHELQDEGKKIFAVESPDGDSDALRSEELHEVEDIIDYAAAHEDKEKILKRHAAEEAVHQDRIRDPEHDW